ncbi:MAG: linear amide C-N hydrolase, partial [Muribaculaceae bacterium]|nr:linear amide C-N hydrolase [Muribaculaceae bacterium]
TNIYVYPAGMKRMSMPEGPAYNWTSKYGSVMAVSYDGGVTEGMNDQGLVMNGLFCKTGVYRTETTAPAGTPVMSLAVLVSYFLDNFATVEEAYTWWTNNDFAISGKTFDGGTVSQLHWGITDATGDTMVAEYADGQLRLYRGRDLQVLTNDPELPKMQAINDYWKAVGGVNMLPGTVRSTDRFVRADFFIHHTPTNFSGMEAVSALSTVMANVSVPYGYNIVGEPNVSMTQWRSIADLKRHVYYFRFANTLGNFWIDLDHLMLTPGSPVLKLDTQKYNAIYGCANEHLVVSKPFTPMW